MSKEEAPKKRASTTLLLAGAIVVLLVISVFVVWQLSQVQQQLAEKEKELKKAEEKLKKAESELEKTEEQLKRAESELEKAEEEIQKLKKPYELAASVLLRSKDEVIKDKKYATASSWRLSVYSALLFTPDEKYLVVADYKNRVLCIDTETGKVVWEKEFPERMGYSAAVSPDGRYVYLGFRSLEGEITCLEVSTGNVVWEWKVSEDLGEGDPKSSSWYWPTVYSIQVSPDGKYIYIAAKRQEKRVNYGRVYCLDASSGKVVWRFPRDEFIDSCIPYSVLSPDAKYFAFHTWYYGKEWGPYKVVVLDSASGELVYALDVNKTVLEAFPDSPVKPMTAWHGIDFTGDGKKLVVVARTGVVLAVDHEESVARKEAVVSKIVRLSAPLPADVITKENQVIQGFIYAYTGYIKCAGDYVFVFSSNTYGLAEGVGRVRPALDHPNASKVFVLDSDLKLKWMYDMGGKVGYGFNFIGWSADGRIVAVPVGHNWIKMSNDPSGVLVFDMAKEGTIYDKVVFRYHTEGTTIAAAVSPGGRYVAVIELPINVAPPGSPVNVVGEYQVLLFRLKL